MIPSSTYFLQTECLGFRKWREEDFDLAFGLWGDFSDKWGKGYATEAAHRVIQYAVKELKVSGLFAGHHPENGASRHLLLKLGFRYTHDEFYEATGLKHPSYLLENLT